MQRSLETLALDIAKGEGENVQVAIVAVDIEGRAVRASVGSASRERAGGWLDLTSRKKSPGSTLKPFVYGMAFDDGIAVPATRIADLPRRFNSYRPENFDRTFRGDVTVAEALQHSLNVPAVHLLDRIGAQRFMQLLSFSGANIAMPDARRVEAGLALALGGVGMDLQDIAVLYAALGDGGTALPLNWTESALVQKAGSSHQVMSPESAARILKILRSAPTPQGRMPAQLTRDAPQIAFKTGTSYGFRDAWAAGISGGRVIVVWIGYADGTPRPGHTGRNTALPVLFDAFDLTDNALGIRSRDHDHQDIAEQEADALVPLAEFESDRVPEILFPPDGTVIWADHPDRNFVLSARGTGKLDWYVDGVPALRRCDGPISLVAGGAWFLQSSGCRPSWQISADTNTSCELAVHCC